MGLAGIGDLYVSACGGRNSKMGEYLGKGMNYEEAKKTKMPNEVDWTKLTEYEEQDMTAGSQELACSADGGCEIVDLTSVA